MKTPNNIKVIMKALITFMPVICTFSVLNFYAVNYFLSLEETRLIARAYGRTVMEANISLRPIVKDQFDPEPDRTCTSVTGVCLLAFNTPTANTDTHTLWSYLHSLNLTQHRMTPDSFLLLFLLMSCLCRIEYKLV